MASNRTHDPLPANVIPSETAPVRDISPFRGEPPNPFARTFFPRRELRVRTFSRNNGNIARIRLQTCNR